MSATPDNVCAGHVHASIDISCSSATRIRNHDLFMLLSLWMEFYPVKQTQYHEHFAGDFADHFAGQQQQEPSPRAPTALPTGAVLVDAMGKVAAIEHYCQRKIYYFPAERWELAQVENDSSESDEAFRMREVERAEKNRKTVMRLVSNNPIAFTLFIPQWDHGDIDDEFIPPSPSKPSKKKQTTQVTPAAPKLSWPIDKKLEQSPGISRRWPIIELKFARTVAALNLLAARYHVQARPLGEWTRRYREGAGSGDAFSSVEEIDLSKTDEQVGLPLWARHAMVLAHIAAKRTDDPKLGVGSVFVDEEGRYFSVGWNGYPKKSQHLDYPQAGADDSVEYEELKYDYILHSEQNALLWRNPPGIRAKEAWVVVTKLPCDECSPILYDCGIRKCITIPQLPKGLDDPARLRGLTYNRVAGLMKEILLFEV
ncbi:Cytidine and dCMP deaminase domain-containing protein 1 [Chytriomyces hyalinus]|nr:Cytidine and dCMP deaminase domain-containing protein 1 [Chytriomyces hyalinus]